MAKDGTLDETTVTHGLVPEGNRDPRFAFSRWSLRFSAPGVERAYKAYRNPRILSYLRALLAVGAVMVFAGSLIDHTRADTGATLSLTLIRVAAATGMLVAIAMTYLGWVQRHLQLFVGVGTVAIHALWLITVPVVGAGIYDYTGVLPINIMLTFLVSGLMFRYARWVALAAVLAYAGALWAVLEAPLAPVFYMLAAGLYAGFAAYVAERARREAWADTQALDAEKMRSEKLLLNVLPRSIAERMHAGEHLIADRYEDASVLFADICGFTEMSARMPPERLVKILDDVFRRFDHIAEDLDLEKIKTIGDCYMMACGLPGERPMEPHRIAEAALRMQGALGDVAKATGQPLTARVGIHCGPVVAGVIGHSKFIYDLWGDTVNVASRMESSAPHGEIQVSESMYHRLSPAFMLDYRGEPDLKGKGRQRTYLLRGRLPGPGPGRAQPA